MSDSKDAPILLNEIREHYELFDEARRLERADSQIEKLRTQELLHRYLPPPPGLILDIGGGAGVYAFWLAERGYQVHLVDDAEFAPTYEQDLRFRQHRNPTGDPNYFTTAFFHYPQELIDEIKEAGFRFEVLLAIEGPVRIMMDFTEQWQKAEIQERLLSIARLVEAEPTLWGVSPHIMAIGKKA